MRHEEGRDHQECAGGDRHRLLATDQHAASLGDMGPG
jgi:hypothetical protein